MFKFLQSMAKPVENKGKKVNKRDFKATATYPV